MERKTFVLTTTKDFRYFMRVFLESTDGKTEQRNVTFTTEHKVSVRERNTSAKKIAAEFSTNDERLFEGLLRDTGYGKTFVLKGDPEGKLKKTPFKITPKDAKKIALMNLFKAVNLDFDPNKSTEVLEEEYQVHINATAGTNIKGSGPAKIPHKKVDVQKEMEDAAKKGAEAYKAQYGEEIPEGFASDKALLGALAEDPKFDAKAYIENASADADDTDDIEVLRQKYFDKFGKNVANVKKGDAAWIKEELKK